MSELAADAFDALAARHARSSVHVNRRILLLAAAAATVAAFVILVAIDSIRTGPARRYAAAVSWQHMVSPRCDAPLGLRRFWFGDFVQGTEMCVPHREARPPLVRGHDDIMSFFVIGDWGRDGMCCQRDVAEEMAIGARTFRPQFIVSVGDNFYNGGIETSTDGQVGRSWRNVYISPYESMQKIPWKVILGNHDHIGNSLAQTVLAEREEQWHMPSRYFFETSESGDVFMAFLDTTSLYYTEEQLSQFRGNAVGVFYRDNQMAAFRKELTQTKAKWKIVFGHHPLFSSSDNALTEPKNLKQMRTILMRTLQDNNVAAYISGHEHTLEHHHSGGVHYLVSGAGSKVAPILFNLDESLFALDRHGYMAISLTKDTHEMTVQVVDFEGAVVHSANITRPPQE